MTPPALWDFQFVFNTCERMHTVASCRILSNTIAYGCMLSHTIEYYRIRIVFVLLRNPTDQKTEQMVKLISSSIPGGGSYKKSVHHPGLFAKIVRAPWLFRFDERPFSDARRLVLFRRPEKEISQERGLFSPGRRVFGSFFK